MASPLSFLDASAPQPGSSLGDFFSDAISHSSIRTLVDCLCSSSDPAIYSPDTTRAPLLHSDIHAFVSNFVLPHSTHRAPLGPNDRVMVVLPAGPENALALLALGSYHSCAPVNASCTASELQEDALRLKAKAIVTTGEIERRLNLQALQEELDCEIIHIIPRSSGPAGLFDLAIPDENAVVIPSQLTKPHGLDDTSLILHTSGTSGKKKVVRYSLRTLLVGTWCVVQSWGLKANDINLNMMPLFHVGGIVRNLLAPVLSGGSTIMCLGFDPNAFWSLAVHLKPTWYYAAPTVHHAILSSRPSGIVASRDTHIRMICNAAGGLLPSLASELQGAFNAVVLPSYGMTECMPIATPPTSYNLDRPGCSGIACGPSLSIRNAQNIEREMAVGQSGAVCVRGLPTFEGYEVSPDMAVPLDTSAFSSEGWFDSGDVGYMDQDGYLYITGRSKEIINKGGEVVSPFEVEEAIVTACKDYVKTALAFSVEHNVLQETIGVVIIPSPTRPRVSLQQLHDLLKGHLHTSKWPFAIVYMEELPKNAAGKPLRIGLSKRLGIGLLSDDDSPLHRHFEAKLPQASTPSEPIPCSRVSVESDAVGKALRSISDFGDFALQFHPGGSLDAYVSVSPQSEITSSESSTRLSRLLPGYALPNHVYVIRGPLVVLNTGEYDFGSMQRAAANANQAKMSQRQLLVRDVFADILNTDPMHIQLQSDFFLLGGNSLLLGKLSHHIRKQSGVDVGIAELFTESTVSGIASLIDKKGGRRRAGSIRDDDIKSGKTANSSTTTFSLDYDFDQDLEYAQSRRSRSQSHPLCLLVQALPFLFFHPLKTAFTWTVLLYMLSNLAMLTVGSFWERIAALATSIAVARLLARIVCPLVAIAFKWIVIGRYKPGTYRMWSNYYLRWWIVNQSLRLSGRGIFSMHPALTILYYRMLGAQVGQDVHIDEHTKLYECDLLTLQDGCRLDTASIRGFCVEREGFFRLAPITIGRKAFVNNHTFISPGSNISEGLVYGPHASSHNEPSQKSFAAYNRTLLLKPHLLLRILVAWPIILLVQLISYIPWIAVIYAMVSQTSISRAGLNNMEAVVHWFADPERILYHTISRIVRALFRPLIQVALGIIVKRTLGLNTEATSMTPSQTALLRRYINSTLLSQSALKDVFSILGTHYEAVSVVYRAMGAKIGKRIYWPGSGISCADPELLEIGDDVVFGSRSSLVTTDRIGSGRIIIERGAMIADRVVLLPGTKVGARAVMGSGALGKRNTTYEPGSTWIGNENGEAVCFNNGSKDAQVDDDTITPFGKAFYMNEAKYTVYPYFMILCVGIVVTALSAAYWSICAVAAAQILRQIHIHLVYLQLFDMNWYRLGTLYGLTAVCFVVVMSIQGILSMLWVILTKWILLGRRQEGRYDWDQSSYCQRWQLHLTLSRFMFKGYGYGGVLAPFAGSAYIVWFYRAMGAKMGRNCAIWASGRPGLMTEPDLVELGDDVSLDDCSVVAHINSRGRFSLNRLRIGNGSALRSGSRLLSGASMEDSSMLSEHTLLTSGEVADSGMVYAGWPGKRIEVPRESTKAGSQDSETHPIILTCPICRCFPKDSTVNACGHVFCQSCITRSLSKRSYCPICFEPSSPNQLMKVHLSFTTDS